MDQNLLKLLADLHNRHIFMDCDRLAQYTLAQTRPCAIVEPESAQGASALLDACHRGKAVVNIWGNGRHQNLGGIVQPFDIVLSTRGLNRVIEFSPENLTITAQAGLSLAELQKTAGSAKLFLPVNPANAGTATIGGLGSANQYGSCIQGFGSWRDFLLGGRAVLADGQEIKFGGKTVKNVAGYDMCKLFIGSMGTIGLLTELTLKLWPLPERIITALPVVQTLADCERIITGVRHKALPVLAAVIGLSMEDGRIGDVKLSYDFYSAASASSQYLKYLQPQFPADTQWQEKSCEDFDPECRTSESFFAPSISELLLQWILPKSQMIPVLSQILNDSARIPGVIDFYGYPAAGIIYSKLHCALYTDINMFTALINEWRTLAHRAGGFLLVEKAPDDVKAAVDVWDAPSSSLDWHKKMKREFDPSGVFAGGRFVGGI